MIVFYYHYTIIFNIVKTKSANNKKKIKNFSEKLIKALLSI